MYFWPILRVAALSYPVGGQVFPNRKAQNTRKKKQRFSEWLIACIVGPPTPRVLQWKNFGSRHVEFELVMWREFVWNFLWPFSKNLGHGD